MRVIKLRLTRDGHVAFHRANNSEFRFRLSTLFIVVTVLVTTLGIAAFLFRYNSGTVVIENANVRQRHVIYLVRKSIIGLAPPIYWYLDVFVNGHIDGKAQIHADEPGTLTIGPGIVDTSVSGEVYRDAPIVEYDPQGVNSGRLVLRINGARVNRIEMSE